MRHLTPCLLVASAACVGEIGDTQPRRDGSASTEACDPVFTPQATPLQLLPASQYTASVRAALADPTLTLDLEDIDGDTFTELATEKLASATEVIVARPSFDTLRDRICAKRAPADCAPDFIASFSTKLFRRPPTQEERAWLEARYNVAKAELDPTEALDVVAQIILQAPQSVYVRYDAVPGEDETRALDGYARANRLSFFLWQSAPDEELLQVAASGLETDDALDAQITRMLADPRARTPMVARFVEWLELDGTNLHLSLEDTRANPEKYPNDSEALRRAMRTEAEALIERAIFEHDGSIEYLLTTTDAYVNADLAKLYGVTPPSQGFAWVTLPAAERAGIFTRAAFLSLHASPNVQSPIERGAYLLKHVLCATLGEPPPDATDRPIEGDGATVLSTREATQLVTGDSVCHGCHQFINPFGFALGHYDSLGAFVEKERVTDSEGTDHQVPVDATATLLSLNGEAPRDVDGGPALSDYLAQSPELYQCFAQHWFGNAFNRSPSAEEECAVEAMGEELTRTKRLTDFLVALVRSEAFTMTKVVQ